MPSEAARLTRPVGARDRRVLAALAALGAVGVLAGALLAGGHGGAPRSARCLSYDAAGVLGGGTWHLCGGDATAFCRAHRDEDASLAARCERLDL